MQIMVIHSVPDSKNRTKIGQAMPEKRWRVCPILGPVCDPHVLPAISPSLPNGSEPNFPGRWQMGWNRKRLGAVRAFSQHAAPGLVTKKLTHARSCARRSTYYIAILVMPTRLVYNVDVYETNFDFSYNFNIYMSAFVLDGIKRS